MKLSEHGAVDLRQAPQLNLAEKHLQEEPEWSRRDPYVTGLLLLGRELKLSYHNPETMLFTISILWELKLSSFTATQ